jgi:hypothetical protein
VIPNYDYYEVNRSGVLRSIDRIAFRRNGVKIHYKQKFLKALINNKGYVYYEIKRNGKNAKLYAHRAVALAYIPNPENKPCVNHIDNNPLNNNVSNLEWCTKQENTDWMVKPGRNKRDQHWRDMQEIARKKFYKPVISQDIKTGEEKKYPFLNAVKFDGYTPGNVCVHAKDGKPYRGKIWRYEKWQSTG